MHRERERKIILKSREVNCFKGVRTSFNDMSLSIDKDCKLILYADDSAILFFHKCVDTLSKKN